uniref:Uncharacterized protein n=1 Tax=Rhizophora mucronata TaxID=61149 RepID=A0A2P2QS03_RHIMU
MFLKSKNFTLGIGFWIFWTNTTFKRGQPSCQRKFIEGKTVLSHKINK